jgi:hypothetical protein
VCISVGWRDGKYHTNAHLYENGAALLGHCWRCGYTVRPDPQPIGRQPVKSRIRPGAASLLVSPLRMGP